MSAVPLELQAHLTGNCPHWAHFGGFGHFDLASIDFDTQKFTIRSVDQVIPEKDERYFGKTKVTREFCCASGVASFICRKKVSEIPQIYGDEIECQKMIEIEWCKKLDVTKNLPPKWSKETHGYDSEAYWNKWFVPRKANLRDIFEGNFTWDRPDDYHLYHTRRHPAE